MLRTDCGLHVLHTDCGLHVLRTDCGLHVLHTDCGAVCPVHVYYPGERFQLQHMYRLNYRLLPLPLFFRVLIYVHTKLDSLVGQSVITLSL